MPASHRKWRLQGHLGTDGTSCPVTWHIREILLTIAERYEMRMTPDRAFRPETVTSGAYVITV